MTSNDDWKFKMQFRDCIDLNFEYHTYMVDCFIRETLIDSFNSYFINSTPQINDIYFEPFIDYSPMFSNLENWFDNIHIFKKFTHVMNTSMV